ncbi:hypothetical protein [Sphingomonas psychrotolerans]|uniref:Uncharacterized protein n=1 Tax=Sphingomonas psychrotolerans TaxID=1327635 RepID=A0A2K8MDW3_9SPHN|nr:hypothetical protein [Sphingomonas psychrotolerans]ATY31154.1 hypothetical protein CVN68_03465 [Sphingomonas psychrotolerans]
MTVRISCRLLFGLILAGTTAGPALAEGTRIYVQTFDPRAAQADGLRILADRPEGLETFTRTAWSAARGTACDEVKQQLPAAILKRDSGARVPPHEISCDFGPATSVAVSASGNNLNTMLRVASNHVRLKIELDAGRPDFYVKVPFSIEATIKAHAGDAGRLLTLDAVTARVDAGKVDVDGATVVGDALLKLAEFAKFDVGAVIAKGVESQRIPVDGVGESFNTALAESAPGQVAQAVSVSLWRQGNVTAVVLVPRFPALPRAPIAGAIIARPSMPDCSDLTVRASAHGPGKLVSPFASPVRFTPGAEVTSGSVQTARVGTPVGQEGVPAERRCRYRIADAPIGANPVVNAAIGRAQRPQRSLTVTPAEQTARAPANNVDFQTAWTLASNPDWLETQERPLAGKLRPGEAVTRPGGAIRAGDTIRGGVRTPATPAAGRKLPGKRKILR